MTENNHPPKKNSSFSNNDLIDDSYVSILQEKITKELIQTNRSNCDSDVKNESSDGATDEAPMNLIIARCKGLLGIHFCNNSKNIKLEINDCIIIKHKNEFEYATVIETGELVSLRMESSETDEDYEIPVIERVANDKDLERNYNNCINAEDAKTVFHELISELALEMKLVDIHYQFDRKKLFFFYTADGRVDFRELAKRLAANFKTRIELRQIGVRDEAKRLGGLATCGREYCCSSFLNNFKRITTDIAVENNISTSISKYTGPCGKLKCCLSFELE